MAKAKKQEAPSVREDIAVWGTHKNPAIIMELNRQGTFLYYANPAAEKAFRESSTEKEDRSGLNFIPKNEKEELYRYETPGKAVVEYNRRFYELHFLRHSTKRVLVVAWDVTEYALDLRHDSLTRLPNNSYFQETLAAAIARVKRAEGARLKRAEKGENAEEGEKIAVLFCDVDGFGEINTRFGHDDADNLLKEVAARLLKATRGGDMVARRSGDEFVALANNIRGKEDALQYANRIYETFSAEKFAVGKKRISIRISVGIALGMSEGQTIKSLLKEANDAMYRAKRFDHPCFSTAEE